MKKLMVILGLALTMGLMSAPASAFTASPSSPSLFSEQQNVWFSKKKKKKCWFFCKKKKTYSYENKKSVPEMDAAGAAIAFALMGGVITIMRERRKK